MWFRFPKDVGGIAAAGQEFRPEVEGPDGRNYFRAPDHFAPMILAEEGFDSVGPPSNSDLPDLPQADPERDTTIVGLQAQVTALEIERDGLRQEKAELLAKIAELEKSKSQSSQPSQPAQSSVTGDDDSGARSRK